MNTSEGIGVIILAAGSSSRLGRPKQLIHFKGKSLLQHSVDCIVQTELAPRLLVLGANATEIRKEVQLDSFVCVDNESWSEGIASSIRMGVNNMLKLDPKVDSLLFMLSDQPFVSTRLIVELVNVHKESGRQITASRYKGDYGVPAIFSKSLIPELLTLEGDQGARRIIKRYAGELVFVNFEFGDMDLDTPEDYGRLLEWDH